jgi:molybdate transport system ATP-binding protein
VAAIVGPNGAGKTSVIRAIAGLDDIAAGAIVVNGHPWANAQDSLHLEPARRSTSLVLADPLLFPHLSAVDNIAFGLRARGLSRSKSREQAQQWLEKVDLGEQTFARPAELSTGQQQRVALARALAIEPDVLLLDEPLSAQDLEAKGMLRTQLRDLLTDFDGATILVTHDPIDAFTLSENILVVEGGVITQQGTPAELVRRPATPFVAKLLGLNLLLGVCEDQVVTLVGGGTFIVADDVRGPVRIAFAPHTVSLATPAPGAATASQRNRWSATVVELAPSDGKVRVTLSGTPSVVAEVTTGAVADLGLMVGAPVVAAVKATEVEVYPA